VRSRAEEVQAALPFGPPPRDESRRALPIGWLDRLPSAADCLRDYQRLMIAEIAAELDAGHTRILAQAPTGAGKTHIIAAISMAALKAELRVLVLATRTRLVHQIHERLRRFEVRHGVIAAPLPGLRNYSARLQVASVDTLNQRALVRERIPLPAAELVIFDEAHLATADSRMRVLDSYPAALRVGFTATPARKSGRSLGSAFDSLIRGPSIAALTAAGMLVPTKIFNTPIVSTAELRSLSKSEEGDFRPADLAKLLGRPKLVGDVVTNWLRIANGKRTLCFAVNKSHAADLLQSFLRQGVAAELLTDTDDEATREAMIARLEAGDTRVLVNCFLMSYGVDVPSVECIILARPTRSLVMYLQMVGRGLRASPGKDHCVLIDHGHVVETLGLPHRHHRWSLEPDLNVNVAAIIDQRRESETEATRTCGQCSTLWLTSEQGKACPSCGWTPVPNARAIEVEAADLQEIADAEELLSIHDERVAYFFAEACCWYMLRWPKRWKAKPKGGRWWAWEQTRVKFGIAGGMRPPPEFWVMSPMMPSHPTAGWLKHRMIRFARGKARAA
jgi:DNA repair protein RadD